MAVLKNKDKVSKAGLIITSLFVCSTSVSAQESNDDIQDMSDPLAVYTQTGAGSEEYKDNAYGIDNDAILTHEAAISYQITKRSNVRYFANWTEDTHYSDGDHRIEFNYQF